jgi:prolyl oligopeptidase
MSMPSISPVNKRSKFAVATRRGDHADGCHGEAVPDPYRGLEDGDAPETRSWVAAQNELTESWLASVPSREEIRSRLTRWWDHPRFGVPFERGAPSPWGPQMINTLV